jgi:hypothetical protein
MPLKTRLSRLLQNGWFVLGSWFGGMAGMFVIDLLWPGQSVLAAVIAGLGALPFSGSMILYIVTEHRAFQRQLAEFDRSRKWEKRQYQLILKLAELTQSWSQLHTSVQTGDLSSEDACLQFTIALSQFENQISAQDIITSTNCAFLTEVKQMHDFGF